MSSLLRPSVLGLKIAATGLLSALLTCAQVSATESITLSNGDWPPYMSEDLRSSGPLSHVVSLAFEAEQVDTHYKFFPWKRSMLLAEKGKVDGTLGWKKTPEREENFYYSEPLISTSNVVFYLKSKPIHFNQLSERKSTSAALVSGIHYETFQPLINASIINPIYVYSQSQAFRMLLKKRIELVPQSLEVGYAILTKHFSKAEQALFAHEPVPYAEPSQIYLLLSKSVKGNYALLQRFNDGLKKLRETGIYYAVWQSSHKGEYVLNDREIIAKNRKIIQPESRRLNHKSRSGRSWLAGIKR